MCASLSGLAIAYSAKEPGATPITSSPGRKSVTPAPTASTVPAASQSRTRSLGPRNPSISRAKYGWPVIMCHVRPGPGPVHPDQNVLLSHRRNLEVPQLEHVRRAVPVLRDRLHLALLGLLVYAVHLMAED